MTEYVIRFTCKSASEGGEIPQVTVYQDQHLVQVRSIKSEKENNRLFYLITLNEPISFGKEYTIYHEQERTSYCIHATEVVRTDSFDQQFYYEGDDLGATYTQEETMFKLWAPTAVEVKLLLFQTWYDEDEQMYAMERCERGTWSATIQGDLDGVCYLYRVKVNGEWTEAVDPYAKSVSINGDKGMIVDLKKTNPDVWVTPSIMKVEDSIIYELHVRDFSIDKRSGVKNKGKYLGLVEEKTVGPKQLSTGLAYLEELGITHVELLPLADFGSVDESNHLAEYNWGYDVIHYFSPEGSYASDPYEKGTRICELKKMIARFHEKNIRVILDVVYNHVYVRETSHFEKIVPGYFFRYNPDGTLGNGTGVGNDLASERAMVRKFICDCVTYWAKEYRVDGFRFDLMGIIDVETMKTLQTLLLKINPSLLLLGEGWDLPTPLDQSKKATSAQAKVLDKIGFFHDGLRDSLKGSTFELKAAGFCAGNDKLKQAVLTGIKGNPNQYAFPRQAINYVESHDNHTLWDKLNFLSDSADVRVLMERHRLATSIVLLSQGIPFLHAGQEFFRTKYGVENSYCSPDWVNQVDWGRRAVYEQNVNFIKGLIELRKGHGAFRLPSFAVIDRHFRTLEAPSASIAYHLADVREWGVWKDIAVIHNGNAEVVEIKLPKQGEWEVVVDEERSGLIPLYTFDKERLIVPKRSSMVLGQR